MRQIFTHIRREKINLELDFGNQFDPKMPAAALDNVLAGYPLKQPAARDLDIDGMTALPYAGQPGHHVAATSQLLDKYQEGAADKLKAKLSPEQFKAAQQLDITNTAGVIAFIDAIPKGKNITERQRLLLQTLAIKRKQQLQAQLHRIEKTDSPVIIERKIAQFNREFKTEMLAHLGNIQSGLKTKLSDGVTRPFRATVNYLNGIDTAAAKRTANFIRAKTRILDLENSVLLSSQQVDKLSDNLEADYESLGLQLNEKLDTGFDDVEDDAEKAILRDTLGWAFRHAKAEKVHELHPTEDSARELASYRMPPAEWDTAVIEISNTIDALDPVDPANTAQLERLTQLKDSHSATRPRPANYDTTWESGNATAEAKHTQAGEAQRQTPSSTENGSKLHHSKRILQNYQMTPTQWRGKEARLRNRIERLERVGSRGRLHQQKQALYDHLATCPRPTNPDENTQSLKEKVGEQLNETVSTVNSMATNLARRQKLADSQDAAEIPDTPAERLAEASGAYKAEVEQVANIIQDAENPHPNVLAHLQRQLRQAKKEYRAAVRTVYKETGTLPILNSVSAPLNRLRSQEPDAPARIPVLETTKYEINGELPDSLNQLSNLTHGVNDLLTELEELETIITVHPELAASYKDKINIKRRALDEKSKELAGLVDILRTARLLQAHPKCGDYSRAVSKLHNVSRTEYNPASRDLMGMNVNETIFMVKEGKNWREETLTATIKDKDGNDVEKDVQFTYKEFANHYANFCALHKLTGKDKPKFRYDKKRHKIIIKWPKISRISERGQRITTCDDWKQYLRDRFVEKHNAANKKGKPEHTAGATVERDGSKRPVDADEVRLSHYRGSRPALTPKASHAALSPTPSAGGASSTTRSLGSSNGGGSDENGSPRETPLKRNRRRKRSPEKKPTDSSSSSDKARATHSSSATNEVHEFRGGRAGATLRDPKTDTSNNASDEASGPPFTALS